MVESTPTYLACLTPPGTGAIAVLAVRGPRAWDVARSLFRTRSKSESLPATAEPSRFWLGHMGTDIADEAVLVLRRTDPVPWVELHCHGGREVVALLEELIVARGVERTHWSQCEHVSNGDPLQAEAAMVLAAAPTLRTANIALDQFHGALRRALDALQETVERGELENALRLVDDLLRHRDVGLHVTQPWRVVIAGAPNAGKSSLINALTGYQRSIVSPTPGTTRDVVTTLTAIDGWPIELMDTAGLRVGDEPLEREGVDRARRVLAEADLILWTVDAAAAPVLPDFKSPRLHLVVNKIDLPPVWPINSLVDAVHVSALTGAGVGRLCDAIGAWLVPAPPPFGAAVPFTTRLAERLEHLRAALAAGNLTGCRALIVSLRP